MKIMHTVNKALKYVLITLLSINLVLFGYILFGQVDVIQDDTWTVSVDKASYVEGDIIAATSSYTKLRQVSGQASRYLDCFNANGGEVRYPLTNAVADRAAGTNATGINLLVPEVKEAPTKCHLTIVLKYDIFKPFRYHTEQRESIEFDILLRDEKTSSPIKPAETPPTSQTSSTKDTQPNQTTNNTTNNTTNTTNNNPAPETPEPEQERGILTQVLDLLNPTR